MNVALFDYGAGNLHSLGKALEGAGAEVAVTADWDEALGANALVLPGVGAFSAAVEALPDDPSRIRDALDAGLPCLGICLGMQLFFDTSEEGGGRGIGFIPGRVRKLVADVVPQMGWNDVEVADDPIFEGVMAAGVGAEVTESRNVSAETSRAGSRGGGFARAPLVAYYANSFICEPDDPSTAIAWSDYGSDRYVAAVRKGRTWGMQFHPEKSSAPGIRIVRNFVEMAGHGHRSGS